MFRQIVVPLDRSSAAEQALALAEDVGGQGDARLTLVTAVVPLADDEVPETRAIDEIAERRAKLYLQRCADRVRARGVEAVGTLVQFGEPADVITELAKRIGADLIVISSQGLSADPRYPLGSVAFKVLSVAPCPVLVARRSPHR